MGDEKLILFLLSICQLSLFPLFCTTSLEALFCWTSPTPHSTMLCMIFVLRGRDFCTYINKRSQGTMQFFTVNKASYTSVHEPSFPVGLVWCLPSGVSYGREKQPFSFSCLIAFVFPEQWNINKKWSYFITIIYQSLELHALLICKTQFWHSPSALIL